MFNTYNNENIGLPRSDLANSTNSKNGKLNAMASRRFSVDVLFDNEIDSAPRSKHSMRCCLFYLLNPLLPHLSSDGNMVPFIR